MRVDRLVDETALVLERTLAEMEELVGPSPRVKAGDVVSLRSPVADPLLWAVLETREAGGRTLVVGADASPLSPAGEDLPLPADHPLGPLILRGAVHLWLPATAFAGALRVGRLGAATLAEARTQLAPVFAGRRFEPICEDSEHREWMARLQAVADGLQDAFAEPAGPPEAERATVLWRGRLQGMALAASVLLVIGLATWPRGTAPRSGEPQPSAALTESASRLAPAGSFAIVQPTSSRGAEDAEESTRVRREDHVIFRVPVPAGEPGPYAVAFWSAAGDGEERRLRTIGRFVPQDDGWLIFPVDGPSLPTGRYRLVCESEGGEVWREYPMETVESASPR